MTVKEIKTSGNKPFTCSEWRAFLLTLKQQLCWWVGKEQIKHWLCLPSLEADASKQAKTWVSSQSCTPYIHSIHQGSPAAQLQVPAQLCKSCHSSPHEGSRGQLTYQLLATNWCHKVTQDTHSRGSERWVGAFFHLPHWVAEVQKGFHPKCLKLIWTHTLSPDSTGVTQIQRDSYSYFVEWLLKGYQHKVMTSLIHLNHSFMVWLQSFNRALRFF